MIVRSVMISIYLHQYHQKLFELRLISDETTNENIHLVVLMEVDAC